MKWLQALIIFSIAVFMTGIEAFGQSEPDLDSLQLKAEQQFDEGDEEKALALYNEILQKDQTHLEALWNSAIIHTRIGFALDDEDKMKEYFEAALEYAERALEHHPGEGHAYYAYAVAMGRMTNVIGTRDRIRAAHEIEEKIENASRLIPDYAPVWHLYGVWHSDVANVSGAERAAARFLSGGLPDGSNEKAEKYLKKAIEMDDEQILFRLDLARHYLETDEQEKAKPILKGILEMEPVTKYDPGKIEEAEELLNSL
jgi:tetratricopeptide (TPR) repeat protein